MLVPSTKITKQIDKTNFKVGSKQGKKEAYTNIKKIIDSVIKISEKRQVYLFIKNII